MAGLKVVPVKSLQDGSLDLVDLKEKAEKHKDNLAALMVRTEWNTRPHNLIDDYRSLIHPLSAFSKMVFSTCAVCSHHFRCSLISPVGMSGHP